MLASAAEASFSWSMLAAAMASNVFYQLRMVLAKRDLQGGNNCNSSSSNISNSNSISGSVSSSNNSGEAGVCSSPPLPILIGRPRAERLSAPNMFRVITIISTLQLLPISILLDGLTFFSSWDLAVEHQQASSSHLLSLLLVSGASYYLYNEVAFWVLDLVSPLSHAIANALKRIVLIVAAALLLGNSVSVVGMVGAAVAVGGALMYSMVSGK